MPASRYLALALVCAVTPVREVRASPRTDPTTGRAVFTGATLPHATSIGLNPAAIGLGASSELYLGLSGLLDDTDIALQHLDLDGTRTADPQIHALVPTPGAMIAFIYHLAGDTVTLGFEAHTSPAERFPENRSVLRYHTLGGRQRDWVASVGASFRVGGGIYAGASLSHQNTFLRLRYARDTALEAGRGTPGGVDSLCGQAPCGAGNPLAAEQYDVRVRSQALSTSNLRVNIGATYELARGVILGVGYHTPPGFSVQNALNGHVQIQRAQREADELDQRFEGDSVVNIQFPASVDAELRVRLPRAIDLHFGGRWEDLSRLQAYDVRFYGSTLPLNEVPEWTQRPRGMHDAFAGWIGVEEVEAGRLRPYTFGGRIGFETSSISVAETSPITIAPLSYSLDLGAQWRFGTAVFQLSYGVQYFPTTSVIDSAFDPRDRVACIDSGFDYSLDACRQVRNGYAIGSGAGDYTRIQHAMRFGLRYEFP